MEIRLSENEIKEILTKHFTKLGTDVNGVNFKYKIDNEYEYYGDPQNESRREIKVKKFDGIFLDVNFDK